MPVTPKAHATELLASAQAHFRAGQLDEAVLLCENILLRSPDFAEASHLIGIVACKQGDPQRGAAYFRRATEAAPREADYFRSLSLALRQQGDLAGAETAARSAISVRKMFPEAHNTLGVVLQQQGRHGEAIESFRKALSLRPAYPEALCNLGLSQQHSGHLEEAMSSYQRALGFNPNLVEALKNAGMLLRKAGRLEQSVAFYRRALTLKADDAEASNDLGLTLFEQERFEEAVKCFEHSLSLGNAAAPHVNMANALRKLDRVDDAMNHYRLALQIEPSHVAARVNLGGALSELDRDDDAIALYQQLLAEDPHQPDAQLGIALIEFDQGNKEAALARVRAAVAQHPDNALLPLRLAMFHEKMGQTDAAIEALQTVLKRDPRHQDGHFVLSLQLLLKGQFGAAWPHYAARVIPNESRYVTSKFVRGPAIAPAAARLDGQHVLIAGEQGLGDTLFFLRCAAALKERGASLVYHGDLRLAGMLARTGLFQALVDAAQPFPPHDWGIWAGDLPYLLRLDSVAPLPPPLPLKALPEKLAQARERLAALGPAPYVALTWRAGKWADQRKKATLFKTIEPADLANGLRGVEGTLISVQRHPKAGETESLSTLLGRKVHDWSGANEDLEEMLAVMELVDEYIGVSNTNMHLRAGVGRGAKVLVPQPPEWRWMAEGDQSPWFPGIKVLRQSSLGLWPGFA
jgi:tetratricopeptide (TPR) repeat protein